ncbi:glycosyl transferase [Clostridium folliculivorans]|uniref:Glycosyl transferase n=1 Tax=Clostridium folliculivorans TaxID=2886038 RepID=A0A9W6DD24_9CLOT|nr:glycosyltransferase family 4 protein [Clostridium folliculivorans]GKU27273.1 glycosyl transferase [Clostridium folliculivorans]
MRFYTVFPEFKNIHIKKDVGMIPILLHSLKGYDSTIVCYENEMNYNKEQLKGTKLITVPKEKDDTKDFLKFIIKNAKNIDVLNLYHVTSPRNFKWMLAYKLLNPKGKIYLKLDADHNINIYKYHQKSFKQKFKNYILKNCDLITVENEKIQKLIENDWNIKVDYLPNGFYDDGNKVTSFESKDNVLLSVGRIGAYQKATDILLEAFVKASEYINGWRLKLVGPVDEDFNGYLNNFFISYPQMKDKIDLVGNVENEDELVKYYNEAKIFCLTSRYESFGLVFVEAEMHGCFIITSDHEASTTIVKDEKVGRIVGIEDIEDTAKAIIEICNNKDLGQKDFQYISEYAYKNFYWPQIIHELHRLLMKN